MNDTPDFQPFPKMARLSRECIITEKIDGTNAQILITEDGGLFAGSRTRWITPSDDNYGFARWVAENRSELMTLGPGRHFGEWWGGGIQRGYGLGKNDKRLALFNTIRWAPYGTAPQKIATEDPTIEKWQQVLPECVGLVPVLYRGAFDTHAMLDELDSLAATGSKAAPGFMKPEGIVVFDVAGNIGFKKTLEKDEVPKSKARRPTEPTHSASPEG